MDTSDSSYYDAIFERSCREGSSIQGAAELAAEAYIDGKPKLRGKRKLTESERCTEFWSSAYLEKVPLEGWRANVMTLALAKYLGQDLGVRAPLMEQIAAVPGLLKRAVRISSLVMRPGSARRRELESLAPKFPEIAELCRILMIFDVAHEMRKEEVHKWHRVLHDLSIVDLMLYASMFAFEHLVPTEFEDQQRRWVEPPDERLRTDGHWEAICDIFHWKLRQTPLERLKITDAVLGESLATHLSPFIFPSPTGRTAREDLRHAFSELVACQLELNEFETRSADAFSFDEGIDFTWQGTNLEIVEIDANARKRWERDGQKLEKVHWYWLYRAFEAFPATDAATKTMGRPENHEANRLAYIRAIRTKLRLTEVYGLGDTVLADSGERVDLFQAMLSLELMSAFYQRDFLQAYSQRLKMGDDWSTALSGLALDGLVNGQQNRMPLTWSDRDDKVANIVGWTVNSELPHGSKRMAAAILDFWTTDWVALAARLRQDPKVPAPELLERPILKFGTYLFQLPWHLGLQNNSTAAINNLRRIGAQRGEYAEENRRIEAHLATRFEARGFTVALNWNPPSDDPANAGEIDLICARDGKVLVIELKSTYIRRTQRDAWLHGATTLRKAGRQIQRKVGAVKRALTRDSGLAALLGLPAECTELDLVGWIVDTSIEHDHQRFSGHLKVSLEEILIALRDDHALLNDPAQMLGTTKTPREKNDSYDLAQQTTLYPGGFNFGRFVEVVESEAVWSDGPVAVTAGP
jgi:hypothetical protein